jgi:Tfp pilus tip-associated adhesin PilY1
MDKTTDAGTAAITSPPVAGPVDPGLASLAASEPMTRPLSQEDLGSILATWSDQQPQVDGYKPVFPPTVRAVIYVVCLAMGVLAGAATIASACAGAPAWLTVAGAILAWAAPTVANAFGVAYNPLRLASK